MTNETAQRRIKLIPDAIRRTKEGLKDILRSNKENDEEWNNQRCIDAHDGQIAAYLKQLKEAKEVLAS